MAKPKPNRRRRETFRRMFKEDGPLSLKTHPAKKHEGEIMNIARTSVITIAPTTPVYEAIQIMSKQGFRRLPIADPGTKRLLGIITATDIANYFGGGDKFQIIQQKYSGNFYKAINEPVRTLMIKDVFSVLTTATLKEAIKLMIQHKIGGLPVVDENGKIWAIITERDVINLFTGKISGVKVAEVMSEKVQVTSPSTTIFEATKAMTSQGFRRLPIVTDKELVGIVTVMDVLRYFGSKQVFQHLQAGTVTKVLQTPLAEIAAKNVVTVEPQMDVGVAAKLMHENKIGALPVVEDGKVVGIITERDFFKIIT
ncbi:MAG TPA: CBS domain-containing protein [Candidatus Krumholzibacteriaceae bacterium]|nr:CBS domain-containing protein [Candidatus Krumholzibacteriaceae bacterium]